jgi:hypothetical protein
MPNREIVGQRTIVPAREPRVRLGWGGVLALPTGAITAAHTPRIERSLRVRRRAIGIGGWAARVVFTSSCSHPATTPRFQNGTPYLLLCRATSFVAAPVVRGSWSDGGLRTMRLSGQTRISCEEFLARTEHCDAPDAVILLLSHGWLAGAD